MTSAWSATHQSSVAISSNVRNWYECRIVCVSVLSCPQSCPQPSSIRLLAAASIFPCRLCRTRPPQLHYTVLYCVYCQWFKLRLTASVKRISIDRLIAHSTDNPVYDVTLFVQLVAACRSVSRFVNLSSPREEQSHIFARRMCMAKSFTAMWECRHIPPVSIMCFVARSVRSLFFVRSTLIRKVKRSKNKKLSWCWQTRATRLPRVWFPISVL